MSEIRVIDSNIIYENPKPTLMSRHGFFPGIVELPSGDLVCLFVLGEAFESVDQTTHVARSVDGGKTWRLEGTLYDKSTLGYSSSDCAKPTLLKDGRIIAMGYRFDRSNEGHDLVNVKTGGVRNGQVIVSFSNDNGKTWEDVQSVSLSRSDLLEISGPCVQLQNGDIIAGGPAMPDWETGDTTIGHGGVLLRSTDGGKTWDDSRFYYKSSGDHVSPYETRFTQLEDGTIAAIVWAHNHQTGKNMTNHLVLSNDNGYTWSSPIDTGIYAQASNIIGIKKKCFKAIETRDDTLDCKQFAFSDDNGHTWSDWQDDDVFKQTTQGTLRTYWQRSYVDPENGLYVEFANEGLLPSDNPIDGMKAWVLRHRISRDGGKTFYHDLQVIQNGEEYSSDHSFEGVWKGKNAIMLGDLTGPAIFHNGKILLPVQTTPIGPDGEYYNPGGGCHIMNRLLLSEHGLMMVC